MFDAKPVCAAGVPCVRFSAPKSAVALHSSGVVPTRRSITSPCKRGAWKTRAHIFTEGLSGRLVDGMLVRVSQIVPDAASATPQRFELQEDFLAQLVRALPANARDLLVGNAS